jgi:succinoglycan biosynthesis protein ExoL
MLITFVLSHIPDPRMNKRITLLKDKYQTSLVFWNRKTVDIWKQIHTDIERKEISIKANYTSPLKRIVPTCAFAIAAIKHLYKMNPKCLYTENVDMLVICSIYSFLKRGKPAIIYEIADLNKLIIDQPRSLVVNLLQKVIIYTEMRLCRGVSLLVLTSERFYEIYYKNFFPKNKTLILPNMPNLQAFFSYKPKVSGKFTIGFIGVIRYKEQMKMLIKAAKKCQVNLLFAGTGLDDEIENLCKDIPNIKYYGKYDFDTEIASLYGKCDCIYSVYDADLNNVKVALPNKLYEAIFCELPIIVAKGTYLAALVKEMGVGIAVSHTDVNELIFVLEKLVKDKEYYNSFTSACRLHKQKINLEFYNTQLKNYIGALLK